MTGEALWVFAAFFVGGMIGAKVDALVWARRVKDLREVYAASVGALAEQMKADARRQVWRDGRRDKLQKDFDSIKDSDARP